ncbi:hypothetical protein ES703_107346 [subsurface metagenome]
MPRDPIPSIDLPVWIEDLILLAVRIIIKRYFPALFNPEDRNGPSHLQPPDR